MSTLTLYGISNCDTVKKARQWLGEHGIEYAFVDYRDPPLTRQKIEDWSGRADWQRLLNIRSRTWRDLPEHAKESMDKHKAIDLMHAHPTLIKRPVLEYKGNVLIGFDDKTYTLLLQP